MYFKGLSITVYIDCEKLSNEVDSACIAWYTMHNRKGNLLMVYNLKCLRIKKGYTQEQLSLKSNVSRATISKIENDEEVEVKVSTLIALAEALEVPLADFFMTA